MGICYFLSQVTVSCLRSPCTVTPGTHTYGRRAGYPLEGGRGEVGEAVRSWPLRSVASGGMELTWQAVVARRMRRHYLTEPAATPVDVVRAMSGAHAQILAAGETSALGCVADHVIHSFVLRRLPFVPAGGSRYCDAAVSQLVR